MTALTRTLGVLVALLVVAAPPAALADAPLTTIQIDVVVNIQTEMDDEGSFLSTTKAQVEEAIKAANAILKQAGIKLNVKHTNDAIDDPVANAGNADKNGSMTDAERKQAREAGGKELDDKLKKPQGDPDAKPAKKGIKIYFCSTPWEGTDAVGNAKHKDRTIFVSPLQNNPKRVGERITHEVCHALTLDGGHTVVAASADGTTPAEVADDDGHTTKPNNVMGEGEGFESKDVLTPAQRTEIRKQAEKWGNAITKPTPNTPSTPKQQQSGGGEDDHGETGGSAHLDIGSAGLFSSTGDATVNLEALMNGFVLDVQPVNAVYRWLFDSDNNLATGVFIAGFQGIDREVEVIVIGDGLTPAQLFVGVIDHAAGGMYTPVPDASWAVEHEFDGGTPEALPARQSLEVDVDKALLGLSAELVPVILVTEDVGMVVVDTFEMFFDTVYFALVPQLLRRRGGVRPPRSRRMGAGRRGAAEPGGRFGGRHARVGLSLALPPVFAASAGRRRVGRFHELELDGRRARRAASGPAPRLRGSPALNGTPGRPRLTIIYSRVPFDSGTRASYFSYP